MQPILRAARVKTHTVSAFKGVWRAGRAPEGYFADAVNLTSAQYPALSTRAQRRVINDCAGVTAMYSHDRMLWLDGTALYYGDDEVGTLTAGEKQSASMGANVVIYPDKKLSSVKVKSIRKRFKEHRFAAGANREYMMAIEETGISFDEFCQIALDAMLEIHEELGL